MDQVWSWAVVQAAFPPVKQGHVSAAGTGGRPWFEGRGLGLALPPPSFACQPKSQGALAGSSLTR